MLGRKIYLLVYLALMFGPAAIIVGMVVSRTAPAWLLLGLLALPIGLVPARFALRNVRRPDADALTAKYMTAFGGLIFLALILAGRSLIAVPPFNHHSAIGNRHSAMPSGSHFPGLEVLPLLRRQLVNGRLTPDEDLVSRQRETFALARAAQRFEPSFLLQYIAYSRVLLHDR